MNLVTPKARAKLELLLRIISIQGAKVNTDAVVVTDTKIYECK
jgi:hypothetical protein